jgi:hypothetical protein
MNKETILSWLGPIMLFTIIFVLLRGYGIYSITNGSEIGGLLCELPLQSTGIKSPKLMIVMVIVIPIGTVLPFILLRDWLFSLPS